MLPCRQIYQSGVLALSYAQGIPVIAADVGSFRDDVVEGETGCVFAAGDVADLPAGTRAYFASELSSIWRRDGRRFATTAPSVFPENATRNGRFTPTRVSEPLRPASHDYTEISALVLMWSVCRWRPGLPARESGTRPLVALGASLAISGLIFAGARAIDIVILGRFFGPEAAGLYSRAMALLVRPLEQILPALHSIFVPALSRLQNDPARYRRAFLQVQEAVALTIFPATGLLVGLAEPLTRVLFGPGWEGVTPIFAVLSAAGLFLPLTSVAIVCLVGSMRRSALEILRAVRRSM
jgi:hypothetical protein